MIQEHTTTSQGAPRTQPVSQDRKDALLKLIQVEPDHIGNLTDCGTPFNIELMSP